MLGRMQMDVDTCIKVYCDLAVKIFPEDKAQDRLVCAPHEKQTTPVVFRTNASKHAARVTREATSYKAGRATTAAPFFNFFFNFNLCVLDGTFADGGLVNNHPIQIRSTKSVA